MKTREDNEKPTCGGWRAFCDSKAARGFWFMDPAALPSSPICAECSRHLWAVGRCAPCRQNFLSGLNGSLGAAVEAIPTAQPKQQIGSIQKEDPLRGVRKMRKG